MISKNDKQRLQELAGQVAEIAALPVQEEKKRLWRKLNARQAERPMVMIDQVCWNEMTVGDELAKTCTDKECRMYEGMLLRILYRWKHFPVDMVVDPFFRIPKAVHNTGFGIGPKQDMAVLDPHNVVVGHKYHNQFKTLDDLEKIKEPIISHDSAETERRLAVGHEIFDGLLEVRATGMDPYLSLWDSIASFMGMQNALLALMDQPDLMHGLVGRMTDGYLSMLDQLQEQGLLCGPQSLIHCTGAFTEELPADGYDPDKVRTKDLWMFGLAQVFSEVSPKMFKEFEVDYVSRICERFGLVYYGCCDPLDRKMKEVRMIPNVRKVSMSPWVDQEVGAAEIGKDFVYSRKPNPAFLAETNLDQDKILKDLRESVQACKKNGCSLEFIQKDISTVRYQPDRLTQWANIAMQVAEV